MSLPRDFGLRWVLVLFFAAVCFAQLVISTKPGTLHLAEGELFLDEAPLSQKPGRFPTVEPGRRLRTAEGRAELILSPTTMLWMGTHSEVELVSDDLLSVDIRLHSGSAVMIRGGAQSETPNGPVTVLYQGIKVRLTHKGIYRFDAAHGELGPQLFVRRGKALVETAQGMYDVRSKRLASLAGPQEAVAVQALPEDEDELDAWSRQRHSSIRKASRRLARLLGR